MERKVSACNGRLLAPDLPIAVDFWKLPGSKDKFKTYLYFLTHLHSDHTKGLTSTWTETIYTSPMNRELAITMLKVKPELIKPLELNVSYSLVLPLKHGEEAQAKTITVTLIDANHIKGSVMFLFEGSFGRLLYTGDFRWCKSMKENPLLKNLAETKTVSVLFVDNTFEEIGNDFPSRASCEEAVLKIVKKFQYHRIIFGTQSIGKEDVLLRVALERKDKVYVPPTILNVYRVLGMPCDEYFTTDQAESSLWFEKLFNISQFDLKAKNREMPTIAIKLTASGLLYKTPRTNKEDDVIFTVPYSNHCSATELSEFLDFIQPRLIERIVPTSGVAKRGNSVIDSYLASNSPAEMTDDTSFDSTEQNSLDFPPYKSQVPDFFQSAVSQLSVATEQTALSEDLDSMELSGPPSPQVSEPVGETIVVTPNWMLNAKAIIDSVNSDLSHYGDDHIYTEEFIEKLMSLHRTYEPITGLSIEN